MRSLTELRTYVGLAFVAGACVAAGCTSEQHASRGDAARVAEQPPRCRIGAGPTRLGNTAGTRATVLACALTRNGLAVELVAIRDAGGPCLEIAGLPGGTRGCGRAPSERVPPARAPIGGPAVVRRSKGAPIELYGETAPNVRRLVLRYRLPARATLQRDASLIRAVDPAALKRAGIREPFGYFVGAVPPAATDIWAEARDASGRMLGRLRFEGVVRDMHPTVFIADPR